MREPILFYGGELRALLAAARLREKYFNDESARRRLTDAEIDEWNDVATAAGRIKRALETEGE